MHLIISYYVDICKGTLGINTLTRHNDKIWFIFDTCNTILRSKYCTDSNLNY